MDGHTDGSLLLDNVSFGCFFNLPYLSFKPIVHLNTPPKATSSPNTTVKEKHYIAPRLLKLEDLAVLKRSPDLLNNVKIGQDQLRLIMKHFLFWFKQYFICN